MAKQPWAEDVEKKVPKCWYEPLTDPEKAKLGLRFTLSHPVTAALPPGNEDLFSMALGLATGFKPLSQVEVEDIKEIGMARSDIFKYLMS